MASFNFPTSPANGDTYTLNGVTYEYNSVKTRWEILADIWDSSPVDTHLADDTIHFTQAEISITESQINDLQSYLTAETDPVFTAWDKSTGISITESQISDLQAYLTSETDPVVGAVSGIVKADGLGTISAAVAGTDYLVTETDPVFTAWDKSTGISITESQISDLGNYLTTETDPIVGAISGLVKANGLGVISAAVAGTDYLVTETDPVFSAWDKSTGISITESQISDFGTYEPADATILKSAAIGATVQGQLTAGTNISIVDNTISATGSSSGGTSYGLFTKADTDSVAFTKTAAGTASIKAGTKIEVGGGLVEYASATAITMPTLAAGTDYAIWVGEDATIQATTDFVSAPDELHTWRKIGGFHYAPGENADAMAGGNETPAINEYSFWDLRFRPACSDPRGMTLVAGSFWADIYLCGADHITNGTSKYNVTIADGTSPPKIPTKFGGNGTTAYSDGNWWNFAEVLQSHGKRLPTYSEFAALAYGTTEADSNGTDPVSTTLIAKYTSKWGVIQSSGCLWTWGDEFGGGAAAASWTANTGGRGSTFQMENAALFGCAWDNTSYSGSRASVWYYSPTISRSFIGARGVADHLILE
jgi:hypothetical protein